MSTQLARCDALLQRHPRTVILATLAALGAPWVVDNYRRFLALGQSGLTPLGPFGWLVALSLTAFGRETVSTTEYESAKASKERWLETPVERRGTRPETGWHCVPHRQLDRLPSEEIAKRLDAVFEKHTDANPTLVQIAVSPHEKLHPGMIIHPDIPSPHKDAEQALREIAHIHPTDHSLHVILSPADSKTAIDLGWAERHPLSGVSRILPLPNNYLLVYAPRDDEELEVVERIIVASIGYMTGSRSVA
ncbi:hypothetical protein C8F04DRAFT_1099558 [Mycena alexandri]|uniref:Luciferase domain-containing protein n=1 Tax=Mycena alexandri TaxID=1745969 RepID=A0AAD6X467_9AGAR|nr:hypothetical protein C8F04DRAFT_1099558 [Mycena alexandri]